MRGLTWDHPRGYVVLDALAAGEGGTGGAAGAVRWDRQPLEEFESRPLRTLADDYDLVVIDHPGLGEAVRDGALLPLDLLLSDTELAACAAVSAGRSLPATGSTGNSGRCPSTRRRKSPSASPMASTATAAPTVSTVAPVASATRPGTRWQPSDR